MAIKVSYTDNGFGVEVKASGTVYGHEVIDAHKLFYPPEILPKLKYVRIDKIDVDKFYVSEKEVRLIAEIDKAALAVNPTIYFVMIVQGGIFEILSTLWKDYLEESGSQTVIFHTRADAEMWLVANISGYKKTISSRNG